MIGAGVAIPVGAWWEEGLCVGFLCVGVLGGKEREGEGLVS